LNGVFSHQVSFSVPFLGMLGTNGLSRKQSSNILVS